MTMRQITDDKPQKCQECEWRKTNTVLPFRDRITLALRTFLGKTKYTTVQDAQKGMVDFIMVYLETATDIPPPPQALEREKALEDLRRIQGEGFDGEDDPHHDNDTARIFFVQNHAVTIEKALQSPPTVGGDNARLKEIINSLFWAYGNHATPSHIDSLCSEAIALLSSKGGG